MSDLSAGNKTMAIAVAFRRQINQCLKTGTKKYSLAVEYIQKEINDSDYGYKRY